MKQTSENKREKRSARRRLRPSDKRGARHLNISAMIDEAFARKININIGGRLTKVIAFEAILLQLWQKATKNQKRALRVLHRFYQFAADRAGGMGGAQIEFPELRSSKKVF